MKTKLLTISLALTGISAMAQTFNGVIFKTADGKVIPADKVDSVKKALGGNIVYKHNNEQPNVMYLIAKSTDAQKAETTSRDKFAAMIGQAAPYFNVTDIKGKNHDLAALKGKVIVLNFWFVACGGCIAEMPTLNHINAGYAADQVEFLAFALDKADQLKGFLKKHAFNYAIIPNAGKTHKDFGVYACPVSMVIDRNGRISAILDAEHPVDKALPDAINAALKTTIN